MPRRKSPRRKSPRRKSPRRRSPRRRSPRRRSPRPKSSKMESLSDLNEYFGPPTLQDIQTMLSTYDLKIVLPSDETEPNVYSDWLDVASHLYILLDLANNPKPQSDLVQLVEDPPPEFGTPAYFNELQTYGYIEKNQAERNARSGRPLNTYVVDVASEQALEQVFYSNDLIEDSRARHMDRTGDITADFEHPELIPGNIVDIIVERPFNDESECPYWDRACLYTGQYNVSVARDTYGETPKSTIIFNILDFRMSDKDIKMFCDYCMGRFTTQDVVRLPS